LISLEVIVFNALLLDAHFRSQSVPEQEAGFGFFYTAIPSRKNQTVG